MTTAHRPIVLATRGSALALAQAHHIHRLCQRLFPELAFEIRIIKTTGDKLQTASLAQPDPSLPKGLFTKELEVALLHGEADLAVHSLKDLPTDLPSGLTLGAVDAREDVRDVLLYRDAAAVAPGATRRGFPAHLQVKDLPPDAVIATSSTRRRAQLQLARPDLRTVEIRGNVATRIKKLMEQPELDATVLAAAGLRRLHFEITADGRLRGEAVPEGVLAALLPVELMLPCVGQAAIGIEIRQGDERLTAICDRLNHRPTFQCITAERAFLRAMGGGCQSPVAALGEILGDQLRLRAVSFREGPCRRAEATRPATEAAGLGQAIAAQLA